MNTIRDVYAKAVIDLLQKNPYFATVVMNMNVVLNNKVTQTAAMNVTKTMNLYINPKFFISLSEKERVAILEHEIWHLVSDHISRAKVLEPELVKKSENIIDIFKNKKRVV